MNRLGEAPPLDAQKEFIKEAGLSEGSWEEKLTLACYAKFAVPPRRGDAILFYSQRPDGHLDVNSLHGACPVLKVSLKRLHALLFHTVNVNTSLICIFMNDKGGEMGSEPLGVECMQILAGKHNLIFRIAFVRPETHMLRDVPCCSESIFCSEMFHRSAHKF